MGEKRGMKALEAWCRRITDGYRDVHIENMTTAWRDGLAFCALIHHFRPDLIDFDSLSKENILHNNELAFSVAEKQLGIPALLEAEDMVKYKVPDKLSIMTYVSQFYQFFQGTPGHDKSIRKTPKRTLEGQDSSTALSPDALPSKVIALRTPLSTPVRHDVCQACQHRVYILERLIIDSKLFHRTCFKCHRCQTVLKPGSYVEGPSPGLYECVSCPDEEAAEKAALASMAAARIAHISQSNTAEQTQKLTVEKQEVKLEDMKIASAATKARKAFVLGALNDAPSDVSSDITNHHKHDQSETTSNMLNTQSSYLLGKSDLDGAIHISSSKNDVSARDNVNTDSIVSENFENKRADDNVKAPNTTSPNLMLSSSKELLKEGISNKDTKSESSLKHENTSNESAKELDSNIEAAPTISKESKVGDALHQEKDEIQIDVSSTKTELPPKSTSANKLRPLCSPSPISSDTQISNKCVVKPSSRPLYSSSPTSADSENSLLFNKSPTRPPRQTPSPSRIRKNLSDENKKPEELAQKTSSYSKSPEVQETKYISTYNIRPLSPTSPPPSSKPEPIVVRDMPIIKPKISQEFLRIAQNKANDNVDEIDGSKKENDKEQTEPKSKILVPSDMVDNLSDIKAQPKTDLDISAISSNQTEPENTEKLKDSPLKSVELSPGKSSDKESITPFDEEEENKTKDVEENNDVKDSEKELKTEVKKKVPPPRPQPPAKRFTSLTLPSKKSDYPEDLNPFSDDDEGRPPEASKSETELRKSLNPFDSEDDEEENMNPEKPLEEGSESSARRRIPFGAPETKEPEQPRTKIVPPPNINPFWSDGEEPESDEETDLKNASVASSGNENSASRLSVKPVPLPRKSLENLNLSPTNSLSKSTGKKHLQVSDASPTVSPSGSLSKASGKHYSSRDSGSDISPSGSLSKASSQRKKRPAPLPPMLQKDLSETSPAKTSPSRKPHPSPRSHKKSPAPPPPPVVSLQQDKEILDTGFSEKTLKELDNMSMKSTQSETSTETIPVSSLSNRTSPREIVEKDSSSTYKNTFGYWKKKKPAPPVPLPPKRQIKKIPLEEIQKELIEIEEQQLRLEKQGVEIEKTIREGFDGDEETTVEEEDLVLQLFELVNEKNVLFRRQAELVYLKRQQRLEEEHAELEFRIRCLMNKPDHLKTEEEREQEEELISHLMVVVEQRNEIIESMEIDRLREAQEDQSIQEKLAGQKGSSRASLSSQGSATSLEKISKKDKKKTKKEKTKIKGKSKEKEKSKCKDEDKDLDEVEVALREKEKKEKKRKWF